MRSAAALILFAAAAAAQFQTTSPLVVAPTTVTDAKGRYIDGLTASDLVLYDNNVPQTIQIDSDLSRISLVVAIENSANSQPVIDKLGRTGILLSQMLAGGAGETAIVSFSRDVRLRQDFTRDPDLVTHLLRMLTADKGDATGTLDAIADALRLLDKRPPALRRIILVIAEKRDRGSVAKLAEVAERVERLNATIYWLTYSPFLQPFTTRPRTMEDLKPEAERIKSRQCLQCPDPDDTLAPDDRPTNLLAGIAVLARLHQPDLAVLFTAATGGRALNFLKKSALEEAIQLVSEEAHRQYMLTFAPKPGEPGQFHSLRVEVKDRPELRVRTRGGYWN